ncbi:MAG: (2Fe-2S)-binding protein [Deltaproteobacteria bacterium]|nr:MAG: (2Fe-2S)-binding protein [Deltaproteobacteria bacterium]
MQITVRFLPSGACVRVPVGTTLLEAARRASLPIARACGADGICGRCGMEILAGADGLPPETRRELDAKRRNRVPEHQRLACRVAPTSAVAVTTPYW